MKKLTTFFILLSIAFSANAQVLLLETSFDTDIVADTTEWSSFLGTGTDYFMKVENGELNIFGHGAIWKKGLNINNYLVTSEMYAPTVESEDAIQSKSKCGIMFHTVDNENCFYVVIQANSIGTGDNAMIRLRKMVEGTQDVVLNHIDAGMPVAFDEKVRLGVKVESSTFTFYLAKAGEEFGDPITSYTDPDATYTNGSVGLFLLNPSVAFFDNLIVTSTIVENEAIATAPTGWVEGAGGKISNLNELRWLSETSTAWDENWVITKDIDASQTTRWNNGAGFSPIDTLVGAINGQGHTIKGITINNMDELQNAGFCNTILSTVSKLGLIDCNIYTKGKRAGAFAASMTAGTLSECYSTGEIKASTHIGGLVGVATGTATIENCYSKATVLKNTNDQSLGNAAGLVGMLDDASSSYSLSNCYYVGKSRSPIVKGGGATGTVTGCYYDTEASDILVSDYAHQTGLTTAEMLDTLNFTNWDFTKVWKEEADDYFTLRAFHREPSAINTPTALDAISFYPNPASDVLNITTKNETSVSILDMNGRTVISPCTVEQRQEISISSLQAGIYLLKSISVDGTAIQQIIVK